MSIVSVYCVFADADEAERIGRKVVEERLAACVNVLASCRSFYRWDGAVQQAREVPALFKTSAEVAEQLVDRLALLHSYDVPAITVWPVERSFEPYAAWVGESVRQDQNGAPSSDPIPL